MGRWHKIYGTEQHYRAKIVHDLLKQKGLNPIIINKKDSSYNNFGQLEILVSPDDILRALKIINEELCFK